MCPFSQTNLFTAVCNEFSNAYSGNEAPNKTTMHRQSYINLGHRKFLQQRKCRASDSFWQVILLVPTCWLEGPHYEHNSFTAKINLWAYCWVWPLATAISRSYPARLLSIKITFIPIRLKELEQRWTDLSTLTQKRNVTLERADSCLRVGNGHFQNLL